VLLLNQPASKSVSRDATQDPCLEAYQREFDHLMRTFQRLGADPHELNDLAHEVYLILRRTWHEYDPTRALRPYISGIAFRVASRHRRRHWREVPLAYLEAPDPALYPDQALDAARARAIVLSALQQVPLLRRVVLVMHDLDEIPMKEVAATLALPLFTAYSRLRKARRELEAAIVDIQKRSAIR
jgi:RNA polymerase sigma-70 factor, ECF subfamily